MTLRSSRHIRDTSVLLFVLFIFFCSLEKSLALASRYENVSDNVQYLLADDRRLIRYDAADETASRQRTQACDVGLIEAFNVLAEFSSSATHEKVVAAQLITLCSTDNPVNRAKLHTKGSEKLYEGLVSMLKLPLENVDDKTAQRAAAVAGEVIWITSFNNELNQKGFHKAGAVRALSNLILSPSCKDTCHYALMWSAAAMANLAADYCHTDTGHCHYDWEIDDDEILYLGTIEESPTAMDNENIRVQIIKTSGVVSRLIDLACSGPVKEKHQHSKYPWPTRSQINLDEDFKSIIPWAATGALRNLILSPEYPDSIAIDVICFCDFIMSPDWLEYEKAEDSLYRLGLSAEEHCPMPYDETCADVDGWISSDGNNCINYETDALCIEHGDAFDKDRSINANNACCICGGGIIEEDVGSEL